MTQAVEGLIHRVDDTLTQASGRFPMYADPATGEWTWSQDGGWFGGFWPALFWLSAVSTGDAKYNHAATDAACRLRPRTDAPTVLRGLLHWYGAGLGCTLGLANDDTAEIAIAASRSMSADFDPVGQLLPPGEEDASEYHWPRPGACIDGLPGTVPLLAFAAERTHDPMLRSMALSHARALLAFCVRSDGSVAQSATYDTSGDLISRAAISGYSKTSTWARAQTWAMLGLAQAAHLSAEFAQPALRGRRLVPESRPRRPRLPLGFRRPRHPGRATGHVGHRHRVRRSDKTGIVRRRSISPRSRDHSPRPQHQTSHYPRCAHRRRLQQNQRCGHQQRTDLGRLLHARGQPGARRHHRPNPPLIPLAVRDPKAQKTFRFSQRRSRVQRMLPTSSRPAEHAKAPQSLAPSGRNYETGGKQ